LKVNVSDGGKYEKILKIEIPAEEVEREKNKIFKKWQKKMQLPGFRKGKVPLEMVKLQLGERWKREVVTEIVPEKCAQAVEQEAKIKPLTTPEVKKITFNSDSSLSFEVKVIPYPIIKLPPYQGLRWEKEIEEVTEEEVEEALLALREEEAEFKPITSRPVQKGDLVVIDLQPLEAGMPVVGKRQENLLLEIGRSQLPPWLEEKIVGFRLGEERDLRFEEEEKSPLLQKLNPFRSRQPKINLAYRVKVKEIKEKKLPSLEELLKIEGEELNKWKKEFEEHLRQQARRKAEEDLKEKVFQYFITDSPFEVPVQLLQEEVKNRKENLQRDLQAKGYPEEEIREIFKEKEEEIKKMAERSIKIFLLCQEIGKKEKIKVSPEEVEKRLEELAKAHKKTKRTFKKEVLKDDLSGLEQNLFIDKIFRFILAQGEVVEVIKKKEKKSLLITPELR
jgi:trigger factor